MLAEPVSETLSHHAVARVSRELLRTRMWKAKISPVLDVRGKETEIGEGILKKKRKQNNNNNQILAGSFHLSAFLLRTLLLISKSYNQ